MQIELVRALLIHPQAECDDKDVTVLKNSEDIGRGSTKSIPCHVADSIPARGCQQEPHVSPAFIKRFSNLY